MLRGCLQTLPDNKGVEELHHSAKLEAKRAPNKKVDANRLQDIIINSQVVERRDIKHNAMVTKETFLSKWRGKHNLLRLHKGRHAARKHRLPREWSEITAAKSWRTSSEVTDRVAASAWHWLLQLAPGRPLAGFQVRDALLSRWILPNVIFKKHGDDARHWASLGRGYHYKTYSVSWALLF